MSFRAMCFFAVSALCVAAMMMSADGRFDGMWQVMQLFGGIAGIVGISNYDIDRRKTFGYVVAGLLVAVFGGIVTAIIYVVMIGLMVIICNGALWKELNVMCKE